MTANKDNRLGPFVLNRVAEGDCLKLAAQLPEKCIDILVTSPPYWGQRLSQGMGCEDDPRHYLQMLVKIFKAIQPKMKMHGIVWINLGDAFDTPVNWRSTDHSYSSLGADKNGLNPENSAYTKPRANRKAFIDKTAGWLTYGNLLALPNRLVIDLCEAGYLYRGEVIWKKKNPMPEGRCRRPHRQHEPIYLLAREESHQFRVSPPVGSVWEFANERINGKAHFSRFPEELPHRCIEAYGKIDPNVLVFDPFSGSGTTGIAALKLGCSYIGFEIDALQVVASNERLKTIERNHMPLFKSNVDSIRTV